MSEYILSQSYGYGFALGIGALFAVLMVTITHVLSKYANDRQDSENFTVASRSVKKGLLASAVVSSWTWPATLLTSGQWAYTFGVSGSYLYGTSGTLMVIVMAVLAVEIKIKSPGTHTVAEIVRARFGTKAHIVYLIYTSGCNIIVSVLLLLGGAQGFHSATGMNLEAACFLLPLGVIVYTILGGIKATFISDWIHTVIIYAIIIVAMVQVFAVNSNIGSPGKMYDLLTDIAKDFPSPAKNGSYLTFNCPDFIMIVWNVCLGSASSVLGDPSYGQKAIASTAEASLTGYVLGGVCWFIVPFALGTSAGMAALALTKNPAFFTYPNLISTQGVDEGLPVIYGMGALLGRSGAAAALCMLFMSVTSALSAELIGISSILTYDVYRPYVKPNASGKQLVNFSHAVIVIWGITMGAISIGFNYAGVTVGWLLGMMGIVLSPAGCSLVLIMYFQNMNASGIYLGLPLSTMTSVAVWLGTTYHFTGSVDQVALGNSKSGLCANFTAYATPFIYAYLLSLRKTKEKQVSFDELNSAFDAADDATAAERAAMVVSPKEKAHLQRVSNRGKVILLVYLLVFFILIPMPMLGTNYIMSKRFYTGWVVIIFIWLLASTAFIVVMPLFESRDRIMLVVMKVLRRDTGVVDTVEVLVSDNSSENDSSNSYSGVTEEKGTKGSRRVLVEEKESSV